MFLEWGTDKTSPVLLKIQNLLGEISTVESFEVPFFFVKNQLAAFYSRGMARGDLVLMLCPPRDQKALTSLQQ